MMFCNERLKDSHKAVRVFSLYCWIKSIKYSKNKYIMNDHLFTEQSLPSVTLEGGGVVFHVQH